MFTPKMMVVIFLLRVWPFSSPYTSVRGQGCFWLGREERKLGTRASLLSQGEVQHCLEGTTCSSWLLSPLISQLTVWDWLESPLKPTCGALVGSVPEMKRRDSWQEEQKDRSGAEIPLQDSATRPVHPPSVSTPQSSPVTGLRTHSEDACTVGVGEGR